MGGEGWIAKIMCTVTSIISVNTESDNNIDTTYANASNCILCDIVARV